MRFWDSSALVPLIHEEPLSSACRTILRRDRSVAVWALTQTEMVSALHRKRREGDLHAKEVANALGRIELLAEHWTEVDALGLVRDRAGRLLASHELAAAAALQLAAALTLADDRPRGWHLVTADDRLGAAAEAEGFVVIVPR